MNPHTIRRLWPNASASTLAANTKDYGDNHADNSRQAAVTERASINDALEAPLHEETNRPRYVVRYTSIRKRLLDEDNLVSKFHTDFLRYAGILPEDSAAICKIETSQRKAKKDEAETIILTITKP